MHAEQLKNAQYFSICGIKVSLLLSAVESWGNYGKTRNPHSFQAIASIENVSCLDYCFPVCQIFFPPEILQNFVYWASYLLEQGSERVTCCVKRKVSAANVRLSLISCLVSTIVTGKIQLSLLATCTRNGLLVTWEVQNRGAEHRRTNTENCGPYYSMVGLAPRGIMWVGKRILATCLTRPSHSARDGAAGCADLQKIELFFGMSAVPGQGASVKWHRNLHVNFCVAVSCGGEHADLLSAVLFIIG